MTKRILLKLSGEQLQGEFASGFDPKRARWIAEQIRPALDDGAEIVIMVGGGNYVRGNQIIGQGIQPVSAHNIGMLSTLMNAIALADVLNDAGRQLAHYPQLKSINLLTTILSDAQLAILRKIALLLWLAAPADHF